VATGRDYTPYQRNIIRKFYENAEGRSAQNLQEIVTELYLAATPKKRAQLWERARKALVALSFKQDMIDHIISSQKPEVLAEHVKGLF
jgi:hypothetical protein